MWRMFHEANAIEAMGVSIRFAEPTGTLLSKKILTALESSTNKAGLIDKRPIQGFQVNLSNPGEVKPVSGSAMIFQKTSLEKDRDGQVQSVLTNQAEVQPAHLTYNTWRYKDWDAERKLVMGLLLPGVQLACQGVALGAIRVEYLDRFYFDGEPLDASARDILRSESGLVAPHVFDAPDLWHSHTGKFSDISNDRRKLLQVHADFQDLTGPTELSGKRSLLLMTAAELQFSNGGGEIASEDIESFLSSTLDDLHRDAVTLFKDVVDEEFRKAQRLPHD